jgi:DNA-directed RNA polymerase sigma subunit (sigma70/sigma32)
MRVTSLDRPDRDGRPIGANLVDTAPSVEEQALASVRAAVIAESVAKLRPRSRAVLAILFGLGREASGLETVSKELGLSSRGAIAERDYALLQLEHLARTHRLGGLAMAA